MPDDMDLSWLDSLTPEQAADLARMTKYRLEVHHMTTSLAEFARRAWHIVEPGKPLIWNWHLDTLCGYLEAVFRGDIRNLVINIPPGTMKSLIVSVFYPAWVWAQQPGHRFLCGSNADTLAVRDALRMRQIIRSDWFQERWPVEISKEQDEKTLFMNTKGGGRQSLGIRADVTGKRGDTLIIDDPHDAKRTESDVQRQEVLDAWDTGWSSRKNDMMTSATIVIMQRLHYRDFTAHLLAKNEQGYDWVHLVIPMRYDPDNTFSASRDIGRPDLDDPRREPGELLFPQRFDERAVRLQEVDLGPYGAAGQLQQRPSPKGGGEFRREWLQKWRRPPMNGNRCILVDPAGERKPGVTGKKDNSAIGVFEYCEDDNYYLVDGYRDRLNLEERTEIVFELHRKWRPVVTGYERYGMQTDLVFIQDQMERQGYRFKVTELGGAMRKEDRIRRLIPMFAAGRIWLPEHLHRTNVDGITEDLIEKFIEMEYLPFPVAQFDDFFDMMSRLMDEEIQKKLVKPGRPRAAIRARQHVSHRQGGRMGLV